MNCQVDFYKLTKSSKSLFEPKFTRFSFIIKKIERVELQSWRVSGECAINQHLKLGRKSSDAKDGKLPSSDIVRYRE